MFGFSENIQGLCKKCGEKYQQILDWNCQYKTRLGVYINLDWEFI